jgi:hypothetical protein
VRLAAVDTALHEARRRYDAPLARRDELRGLLGAYRDRANRAGKAEDATLTAQYDAAHDVLYTAPCDVTRADTLTTEYLHAVRVATGAEPAGAKEDR